MYPSKDPTLLKNQSPVANDPLLTLIKNLSDGRPTVCSAPLSRPSITSPSAMVPAIVFNLTIDAPVSESGVNVCRTYPVLAGAPETATCSPFLN